jgi:hypothetical protein
LNFWPLVAGSLSIFLHRCIDETQQFVESSIFDEDGLWLVFDEVWTAGYDDDAWLSISLTKHTRQSEPVRLAPLQKDIHHGGIDLHAVGYFQRRHRTLGDDLTAKAYASSSSTMRMVALII